MHPLTENDYIIEVKDIIDITRNAVDALHQISELSSPSASHSNILPFIAELPETLKWDNENSYEYYTEEDFKKAQEENANKLIGYAQQYIKDYQNDNWYTYSYSLSATYEGLYELNPLKVDLAPNLNTDYYNEALASAKNLQNELPDRFFATESADGTLKPGNYRLESIGVIRTLHDKSGNVKLTGFDTVHEVDWLETDDNRVDKG